MGHPHVATTIHRDSLSRGVALCAGLNQCAIGCVLVNNPAAIGRSPDVSIRTQRQAVLTAAGQDGPIVALRAGQRLLCIPAKDTARSRGPDDPVAIDDAAIAAASHRAFAANDFPSTTVDPIKDPVPRATDPDIILAIHANMPRAARTRPNVVDNAFVVRSGHTAVGIRATGVGPGANVTVSNGGIGLPVAVLVNPHAGLNGTHLHDRVARPV